MTIVLEEILVIGPCVVAIFQGPKGNTAEELWLVTKWLVVILGGREDEVFGPSGSI